MASAKQIEASRRNGATSKGPKTAAGKARSAANATTHGLTAEPEIATDGDAYGDCRRDWIAELQPTGVVELALVDRACRAAWRLDRCARHEDAAIGHRDRAAADRHDREEAARADWLGRRLVALPDGHGGKRPAPVVEGDDPRSLVDELKSTAQGAAWLLARWAELRRALKAEGHWDVARKFAAVRMLGLRPDDVLDDPAVAAIFAACYVLAPQPNLLWTDCYRATSIHPAIAADNDRVDALARTLPEPDEASRMLRSLVRRETARLRDRKANILNRRAAADREGAADRSLFDDAKAVTLRLRYQSAASRDLSRSLTDLAKIRKEAAREEAPARRPQRGSDPSGLVASPNDEARPSSRVGSAAPGGANPPGDAPASVVGLRRRGRLNPP